MRYAVLHLPEYRTRFPILVLHFLDGLYPIVGDVHALEFYGLAVDEQCCHGPTTGKSTLVKFIIEALDVEPSKVAYAAFTGKAAEVLRKKGNKNACTLHKLLYEHIPRPGGGFFRKPKTTIEYSIIVVDEISMVPVDMMQQLFKHKVYVICLGDPFQIPPIEKDKDNHLLEHPHIFLDEIMRQAAESEIIRASMNIRAMKPLVEMHGNEVQVFNKADLNTGMLMWADQVLVGTNATRIAINNHIQVHFLVHRYHIY